MATPTTPATTATPATPGARGRMTFSVQRLPQPLLLDQAVLDPTWNTFKTVMVFVGGILFLLFLGGGMYFLGQQSAGSTTSVVRSTRAVVRPRSVATPAPPAINVHIDGEVRVVSPSVELTPEELDRRHTAYLRSHDR